MTHPAPIDLTEDQRAAREAFAALLRRPSGGRVPLDYGAALIAAEDQPGADAQLIVNRLDILAEDLHIPPAASVFEKVARLNAYCFDTLGFRGAETDYTDPLNSYLDRVLDRRSGLPILLSIVYICLAERVGFPVDGIAFPGHFLVSPRIDVLDVDASSNTEPTPRFYIDPFHGGRVLSTPRLEGRLRKMGLRRVAQHLRPVGARQILSRTCNNLKRSFIQRDRLPDALRTIDRLLLLRPDAIEEVRDRGLIRAHLGLRDAALADLGEYVESRSDAPDVPQIMERIRKLQSGG